MRVLLASAAVAAMFCSNAFAADLTVYEAPPAPAVAASYDWTGPYIGVFAGLATGDREYELLPGAGGPTIDTEVSASGFLGGAQVGYDFQYGGWVFGAVADIAATNYSADLSVSTGGLDLEAESELKYLGTVRGRVGYAFDRALIYAHGGFAYGETEQTVDLNGTNLFETSQTRTGWTVGGGVEVALTDRISFGAEYAYVDLGTEEIAGGGGAGLDETLEFHTLKAMVNFRF